MIDEPPVKKAYRVWLGAQDTPLDNHGFAARTLKIFKYCTSHNIEKSVVVTLVRTSDIITGRRFRVLRGAFTF